MNYRIPTRIIGILDLISSTICLIVVGGFGFLFVAGFIFHYATLNIPHSTIGSFYLCFIPVAIFFIALYCCYTNFIADGHLVLSTIKVEDPESAHKCTNSWVYISCLTLCFRGLTVLFLFYSDVDHYVPYHQRRYVYLLTFLVLVLFFVRAFSLYCVIKYRRQLKYQQTIRSSDNIIVRGSRRTEEVVANSPINSARSLLLSIPPRIVADTNEDRFGRSGMPISTEDLPSYESAVFTNIKFYPAPPSYNSLRNAKDIKINLEGTSNHF